MRIHRSLYAICLVSTSLVLGCGSGGGGGGGNNQPEDAGIMTDQEPGEDAGEPDGGPAEDKPDAGPEQCYATVTGSTDPAPGCSAATLTGIEGKLLGLDKKPLKTTSMAQLCLGFPGSAPGAPATCLMPKKSCSDGRFAVTVPDEQRCVQYAVFHGWTVLDPESPDRYADLYCALDNIKKDGPILNMPNAPLVKLEGPGSSEIVGGAPEVTLRLPAKQGEIRLDRAYFTETNAALSDTLKKGVYAKKLDAEEMKAMPCAPDGVDGLMALGPEGSMTEAGKSIALSLFTDKAVGTQVKVYVQGSLSCGHGADHIHEGEWKEFDAEVKDTTTGTHYFMVDVPCLNWVAWRFVE